MEGFCLMAIELGDAARGEDLVQCGSESIGDRRKFAFGGRLVMDGPNILGLISKIDLIDFLANRVGV